MPVFEGRLWLLPEYTSELNVEIQLDEERIRLLSGVTVIGNWPLTDVDLELRNRDIFMRVEGEELIIFSEDPGFAPALVGREIVDHDEPYVRYEPPVRRRSRNPLLRGLRRFLRWLLIRP